MFGEVDCALGFGSHTGNFTCGVLPTRPLAYFGVGSHTRSCTCGVLLTQPLAGPDLTRTRRIGAGSRGTGDAAVKRVVIGDVPDRGGRPDDTRPDPEMPMFRQVRPQCRMYPPLCDRAGHL